jgi:hypothetical protein
MHVAIMSFAYLLGSTCCKDPPMQGGVTACDTVLLSCSLLDLAMLVCSQAAHHNTS